MTKLRNIITISVANWRHDRVRRRAIKTGLWAAARKRKVG